METHLLQTLFQLVSVAHPRLVDSLLDDAQVLQSTGLTSGLFADTDELKQRLQQVWHDVDQSIIISAK